MNLKQLLFGLLLCAGLSVSAAPVDRQRAQRIAQDFAQHQIMRKAPGTSAPTLRLAHEERTLSGATDYYVYNRGKEEGYVIVSGDDCALPVLGYSDRGNFDFATLPDNVRWWLEQYRQQIAYLRNHPQAARHATTLTTAVSPLLTTTWRQSDPYNKLCPKSGNSRVPAGCVAIAMAQIMKKHNYPSHGTGSHSYVDDGTTHSVDFANTTYRWDQMRDSYTANNDQVDATAVATLVYHVGVSVNMDYGTEGSGAQIYDAMTALSTYFGYDKSLNLYIRDMYTLADWEQMLRTELDNGRPILYGGANVSSTGSIYGHAFVFDGYNTGGYFHVNWGWGGDYDGYFASSVLDSGRTGGDFSTWQQAVMGIRPDQGGTAPDRDITGYMVTFGTAKQQAAVGSDVGLTMEGVTFLGDGTLDSPRWGVQIVSQDELTVIATQDNIVDATGIKIGETHAADDGAAMTIPADIADGIYHIHAIYCVNGSAAKRFVRPAEATPYITMVVQNGTAYFFDYAIDGPTILVGSDALSMSTDTRTPASATLTIEGVLLTDDVTLTVDNDLFAVLPSIVSRDRNGRASQTVTVTFASAVEGTFSGTLTIASAGAASRTVILTGKALNGGTASSNYLDISNYETIDAAGWNTAWFKTIYRYQEVAADAVGWLTLPVFGAYYSAKYNGQKWIATGGDSYESGESWNSVDVFAGSTYYKCAYGYGRTTKTNTTQQSISFVVTNCTAVKLLGKNSANVESSYPASLSVVECEVLADGTVSERSQVGSQTDGTASKLFTLELNDLDETKVYKVTAAIYRSYLYEIAFETPLSQGPKQVTLAELLKLGDTTGEYVVTDLTVVSELGDNLLLCKDDNGYAWPDELTQDSWRDYMALSGFGAADTYDQSNWVLLQLPGGIKQDLLGVKRLTGVQGRLTDTDNPVMAVSVMPEVAGAGEFAPNTYVPTGFGGTQVSPVNGATYFFVQPKPMEMAIIKWAVWDEKERQFVTAPRDETLGHNMAGLSGGFGFNKQYLDESFNLKDNAVYEMTAVVEVVARQAGTKRRAAGKSYVVSPTDITMSYDNVITAVTAVSAGGYIQSVTYVNPMGQVSSRPFSGVNIIVTRYTDGTTTTRKAIR